MTHKLIFNKALDFKRLLKRTKISWLVATSLLVLFLILISFKVGKIESWMWVPIVTVSVGSIAAGILYYFLVDHLASTPKIKFLMTFVSVLGFIVACWLSFIFALDQVGLWH